MNNDNWENYQTHFQPIAQPEMAGRGSGLHQTIAEPAFLHTGSHTQLLHMKIKCNDNALSICNCCILYLGVNRFMICGSNVVLGKLEMLLRKEVVKKGRYQSVLTSGVFTCPRQLHDW